MARTQSPALATAGGNKKQWNKMLTETCRKLIARLAAMKGIDDAGIVEILVREEAERKNLKF
jgi:hypothetical protein